jgi:prolyl-tRNA synthetase
MEEFATPKLRTIDDLAKATGVPAHQLVKTMFFSASDDPKQNLNPVAVLLRGSDEANPVKLKNHFGLANPPLLLTDEEVLKITGARPGSCGPVGLKIPILMDQGVKPLTNFIVGANKDDFHLRNVNPGRDFQTVAVGDFRMAKEGDLSPDGKGKLKGYRGIEVGHIFYLGTKYSRKMQANFLTAEGELKPIEMGCYGIGISRTVQAVVEQNHDKDGIIWPLSIAPYHVHLALLDPDEGQLPAEVADQIYTELKMHNIECFIDDRVERPGVKFKDADLIGLPLRVNIGARGLENGEVELVPRRTKKAIKVKALEAVEQILAWIEQERINEMKESH